MSILLRVFLVLSLSVSLFACSSGGGKQAGQESGTAETATSLAPDIKDILGYQWGSGTDVLSDLSMYEAKKTPKGEAYQYTGDPYNLDDFDVVISDKRFEFVDGGLVGAEFVGDNRDDMEKLRVRLVEDFGEPGESSPGYYKWVSSTGTLVLDDVEDYWSLMGWSSDAPDYWQ